MHRIAVANLKNGWHSQQLDNAFKQVGCEVRSINLANCSFSSQARHEVVIPGFANGLPDAVFVRGIAAGSLQQVVYYLSLLHALTSLGLVVYNPPLAIERSVDKAMTTFLLRQAGLNTPSTWVGMKLQAAQQWLDKMTAAGGMVVAKPIFGSQGKDVELLQQSTQLATMPSKDVYYLQEFIDSGDDESWSSWRLFVIAGHVVAAVERVNNHWLNNVARGGVCRQAWPGRPMLALAEAAAAAVGLFYAGVDVICDRQQRLWVIEVNSIPAWQSLQSVTHHNIARLMVQDCLRRCSA